MTECEARHHSFSENAPVSLLLLTLSNMFWIQLYIEFNLRAYNYFPLFPEESHAIPHTHARTPHLTGQGEKYLVAFNILAFFLTLSLPF